MVKILYTLMCLLFFNGMLCAETEEQTINKCVRDLSSKDVMVRRRAVLILGKYPQEYVYVKMLPSLNDPDEKVRQSVVVSFIENRMTFSSAVLPLLRRLADSNVHTRRMVSSALLGRLAVYVSYGAELNAADKKIILKALHDKDSSVRKNMLNNYFGLRRLLEVSDFAHLLGDDDSKIRLLALVKLSTQFPYESMKPYLKKLVKDENPKIRLQTLKTLGRFGRNAMDYFKVMADDKDLTISSLAMAFTRDIAYFPRLKKALLDEGAPSDLIKDLCMTLVSWDKKTRVFVESLLKHSDETRRYGALSALSRVRATITSKTLMKLALEDSSRLRSLACTMLSRGKMTVDNVESLAISDYSDTRQFALVTVLKEYKSTPALLDALYDLMLDEELRIRSYALKAIWEVKLEDRYEIFEKSLSDSEAAVRNLAAGILLNSNDPKAQKILKDFVKNNKKIDIGYLQKVNSAAAVKKIALEKPQGWEKKINTVLRSKIVEQKKAVVDVAVTQRDVKLYRIIIKYLEESSDRELYLYFDKKVEETQ